MACSPVGVISSMDIALCPVTAKVRVPFPVQPDFFRFFYNRCGCSFRSTQRHFSENICSEDDFRSRIFGTFVEKISFLPSSPRIFENQKNEFSGALFLAEIFEKVTVHPYNFRITRLSARKSEQTKNFQGIKVCLYLPFKY